MKSLIFSLALCVPMLTAAPSQGKATITTFDVPGSGTRHLQGTYALSINDAGTVTGYYVDRHNAYHGYMRHAGGGIVKFDASTTGSVQSTYPMSINRTGMIAGYFTDTSSLAHGFVRDAAGTITAFDVPGAAGIGTYVQSINDAGATAGFFESVTNGVDLISGFVRGADGTMSTFNVTAGGSVEATYPVGINGAGLVTGYYLDANNVQHGFVRDAKGKITGIDAPAAGTLAQQGTTVFDISADGSISGSYVDENWLEHGMVRAADGTITSFDVPGAGFTVGRAIAANGRVTGSYAAAGETRAFVRRANGSFATFGLVHKGTRGPKYTTAVAINQKGVIAGTYIDPQNGRHGFVRVP